MVRSSFCINTMPVTVLVTPSRPDMPIRGRKPICTLATSDSNTGTPPCWLSTMLPMSSSDEMTPMPRTLADCSPMLMVRPPTLELPVEIELMICGKRQAERHHLVEIDLDLVLPGVAAHHGNVGDTGHDAQLALDHPVLDRLQLHHVHAWRTGELVAEDFADTAGRRDHRLHAWAAAARPSGG